MSSLIIPDKIKSLYEYHRRGTQKYRTLTPEEFTSEIINRYTNGAAKSTLAREFGVNNRAINSVLEENEVNERPRGRNREGGRIGWENAFSQPTPDALYWAGFFMADATLTLKNWVVDIRLDPKDKDHIDNFVKFVGSPWKTKYYKQRDKDGEIVQVVYSARVYSEKIFKDLGRWGIFPNKGQTDKTEPLGEATLNRDFWRGMIDGDGHINTKGTSPTVYLVGRKSICESFQKFLFSQFNITQKVSAYENDAGSRIWVSGTNARNLLNLLYSDTTPENRLYRKYETAKSLVELNSQTETELIKKEVKEDKEISELLSKIHKEQVKKRLNKPIKNHKLQGKYPPEFLKFCDKNDLEPSSKEARESYKSSK
jgi:hypothetical protein